MQTNKPERVAPDWKDGDDFIQWCRRVSDKAFYLSRDRGPVTATEMLVRSKLEG